MKINHYFISRSQVALAIFNNAKDKIVGLFSHKEAKTEDTINLMSSSKIVR